MGTARRVKTTNPESMLRVVLDTTMPLSARKEFAAHLATAEDPDAKAQFELLLEYAAVGAPGELKRKLEEVDALLETMNAGPLRLGRCVEVMDALEGPAARVRVRTFDGTDFISTAADRDLAGRLEHGSLLALDSSGAMILHVLREHEAIGEIGQLERRVNGTMAEVSLHGEGRRALSLTARLREQLDAGTAGLGSRVVVSPKAGFALDMVAPGEGLAHYQFLDHSPVPNVDVHRDLGAPPAYVLDAANHVRDELLHPELRRTYSLPRTVSYMLVGPSGTGKSYSLQAMVRLVYEIMAEHTGLPVEALPPRVFRLKMNTILNCYLGETEKAICRFIDEAQRLYDEGWTAPDGRRFALPVLIIAEEIDGLTRRRGADLEGIHDRILSSLLMRFDPCHPDFQGRHLLIFCTTNVPGVVDGAFLRRAGSVQQFGRLTRRPAFKAVLDKHLQRVPLAGVHRPSRRPGEYRRALEQITSHFFSGNGDREALVELSFVGGAQPLIKTYTDFFTPAMVAQAVHKAAAQACRDHIEQAGDGVEPEQVIQEIRHEVLTVAAELNEANSGDHLELPKGNRVSRVRCLVKET